MKNLLGLLSFDRRSGYALVSLACGIGLFLATPSNATVSFSTDFHDLTGLVKNGNGDIVGGDHFQLTDNIQSQHSSVFWNQNVPFSGQASFSTEFKFRITPSSLGRNQTADGLAFIISNDPRGPFALGEAGGSLGYGGSNAILDNYAIQFDTHQNTSLGDPSDNYVGLTHNGPGNHIASSATLPQDLADGAVKYANILWFGGASEKELDVYLSETGFFSGPPVLRVFGQDLGNLGGSGVWFGFTGATGLGTSVQDLLFWSISVPEPSSLLLLGSAIFGLGVIRRRVSKAARVYQSDVLA